MSRLGELLCIFEICPHDRILGEDADSKRYTINRTTTQSFRFRTRILIGEREETVHTRFNSHEHRIDGGVLNHGQADVFIDATNYLQSFPPLNMSGIPH